MRPETARRIINATIQRYLNDEPTAIYIPNMIRALNKMYAKQAIWHHEHGYCCYDDYDYDYTPDLDTDYLSIKDEMFYISDRWNSPQRLSWLISGILEEKF